MLAALDGTALNLGGLGAVCVLVGRLMWLQRQQMDTYRRWSERRHLIQDHDIAIERRRGRICDQRTDLLRRAVLDAGGDIPWTKWHEIEANEPQIPPLPAEENE